MWCYSSCITTKHVAYKTKEHSLKYKYKSGKDISNLYLKQFNIIFEIIVPFTNI